MARYLASRLATALVTVLGLVVITFFLLRALPGDPALAILGDSATPAAIENLRRVLGLDQPLHLQFFSYRRIWFRAISALPRPRSSRSAR